MNDYQPLAHFDPHQRPSHIARASITLAAAFLIYYAIAQAYHEPRTLSEKICKYLAMFITPMLGILLLRMWTGVPLRQAIVMMLVWCAMWVI